MEQLHTSSRFPVQILNVIVGYVDYDVITNFIIDNLEKIDSKSFSGNASAPLGLLLGDVEDVKLPEGWKMSWKRFSQSPNVTCELLERGKEELNWHDVCINDDVPLNFFKSNIDRLEWSCIYANSGIPLTPEGVTFLEDNAKKHNEYGCTNHNTPFKFIIDHKITNKYIWSVGSVPLSYMRENIDKIYWRELCRNTTLPLTPEGMSFIRENIESIYWDLISRNRSIPLSFYEENIDNVDWNMMCENIGVPMEFFEKHIDKVDWKVLSWNRNITTKFMDEHAGMISDWEAVCRMNKHLTPEFVKKYQDKVCWRSLSRNSHVFSVAARDELTALLVKIL